MIRISINNDRRRDLNDWLVHTTSQVPEWISEIPRTCVYMLLTSNNNVQQCCDAKDTIVIPGNGYSIKVGKNLKGAKGAIRVNYSQGPLRPCGSANKVFNEVVQYIIIFDPLSFQTTPNELKRIIKERVKDVIDQFFTSISTNSKDWFPFIERDGGNFSITEYFENFDLEQ